MDFIHPLANGDAQNRYRDRQTDPATVAGSVVPADFFNTVQDELLEVITTLGGLTPNAADTTQIRQAIESAISEAMPGAATPTIQGLVELATAAEADAGADAARAVTPAALGIGVRSKAASGYQRLPGGIIIQWLTLSPAGGDQIVNWPIAFPTGFLGALAGSTNGDSFIDSAKAFNGNASTIRVLTVVSGVGYTSRACFVIGIGH